MDLLLAGMTIGVMLMELPMPHLQLGYICKDGCLQPAALAGDFLLVTVIAGLAVLMIWSARALQNCLDD